MNKMIYKNLQVFKKVNNIIKIIHEKKGKHMMNFRNFME